MDSSKDLHKKYPTAAKGIRETYVRILRMDSNTLLNLNIRMNINTLVDLNEPPSTAVEVGKSEISSPPDQKNYLSFDNKVIASSNGHTKMVQNESNLNTKIRNLKDLLKMEKQKLQTPEESFSKKQRAKSQLKRKMLSKGEDEELKDESTRKKKKPSIPERKQPQRGAKPTDLRDKSLVLSAKQETGNDWNNKSKNQRGKGGKRQQGSIPNLKINYEGKLMTMAEFEALPIPKKYIIESVSDMFFEARTEKLCFLARWKYYPEHNKLKSNNEWASNLLNFEGGEEAVEAYFNHIPNQIKDKESFEKGKLQWIDIKQRELAKFTENDFDLVSESKKKKILEAPYRQPSPNKMLNQMKEKSNFIKFIGSSKNKKTLPDSYSETKNSVEFDPHLSTYKSLNPHPELRKATKDTINDGSHKTKTKNFGGHHNSALQSLTKTLESRTILDSKNIVKSKVTIKAKDSLKNNTHHGRNIQTVCEKFQQLQISSLCSKFLGKSTFKISKTSKRQKKSEKGDGHIRIRHSQDFSTSVLKTFRNKSKDNCNSKPCLSKKMEKICNPKPKDHENITIVPSEVSHESSTPITCTSNNSPTSVPSPTSNDFPISVPSTVTTKTHISTPSMGINGDSVCKSTVATNTSSFVPIPDRQVFPRPCSSPWYEDLSSNESWLLSSSSSKTTVRIMPANESDHNINTFDNILLNLSQKRKAIPQADNTIQEEPCQNQLQSKEGATTSIKQDYNDPQAIQP